MKQDDNDVQHFENIQELSVAYSVAQCLQRVLHQVVGDWTTLQHQQRLTEVHKGTDLRAAVNST